MKQCFTAYNTWVCFYVSKLLQVKNTWQTRGCTAHQECTWLYREDKKNDDQENCLQAIYENMTVV